MNGSHRRRKIDKIAFFRPGSSLVWGESKSRANVRLQVTGKYSRQSIGLIWLSALVLTGSTGCPVVDNMPAPGRILSQRDPEYGREYKLYVPSNYSADRKWALVVTCHGTPPWDTASRQFKEWKGLAEKKGFLLVAPKLVGTRGDFTPKLPVQLRRQQEDEEAILSIVRAVKASRSVDPTRVFLFGWSAGGYAVLYTGLRHPDIFRALSIRQGNFEPEFVEPCIPFLDRHQPIQIMYGYIDPLKGQASKCIEWLREHGLAPTVLERPGAHQRDQEPVFAFFADVVRHRPWIRLNVRDDPADAMHVYFSVRTSFEPTKYLWDFGDSESRSPLASPDHRYSKAGLYTVRVALWPAKGGPFVRQVQLQIPRIHLGVASPTSTPGD